MRSKKIERIADIVLNQVESGEAFSIALVAQDSRVANEVLKGFPSYYAANYPLMQPPVYMGEKGILSFPNGAVIRAYSGENNDSFRGPQFDTAIVTYGGFFRAENDANFESLELCMRLKNPVVIYSSL